MKTHLSFLSISSLLVLLPLALPPAIAQPPDSTALPGIFDLLQNDGPTNIAVKTDLSHLIKNKRTFDEYIKGEFCFHTPGKPETTLPARIKCRGRYRRMKCDFPPLKIKFKKARLAARGLNEFNELKLVTHCMDQREKSRDLIVRENLAYKLFGLVSDYWLRTQLVRVKYYNTSGKPKKIASWGILIEDSDELAHRINGEKYRRMAIPIDSFHKEQEQITALFNFMIGNTDWSRTMVRNIECIKTPEKESLWSLMILISPPSYRPLMHGPTPNWAKPP